MAAPPSTKASISPTISTPMPFFTSRNKRSLIVFEWMLITTNALDVGTGSGILAIWSAQAGAKKVYVVEATKMAWHARALVKANNLHDVVEVIEGSVEDISLPEKGIQAMLGRKENPAECAVELTTTPIIDDGTHWGQQQQRRFIWEEEDASFYNIYDFRCSIGPFEATHIWGQPMPKSGGSTPYYDRQSTTLPKNSYLFSAIRSGGSYIPKPRHVLHHDRGVGYLLRLEWKRRRKKGICLRWGNRYGPAHKRPEGKKQDMTKDSLPSLEDKTFK
ncbi:hypothetical protein E3N88_40872 [Mikania micrantha]|uniref:Methyltransferase small domain-containing protein n=1 Tax=Mikania micrantha TaxID=192012 RepID=A0A5N6LNZ0_9ASTR|nr:hypothetical protein E3N88_40872 [Mikania micrantha]